MKFTPTRTCIACRNKGSKENFIKIVCKNKELSIFNGKTQSGRGYYICKNADCINKVLNKKILNKVCHFDCGEEIYLKLKEIECGQD